MGLFKKATIRILSCYPFLGVLKESNNPSQDDVFKVLDCIKKNEVLLLRNSLQIKKLIKDKTVLKRYVSSDILPECEHLVFIQLGIDYLMERAEFEDAEKGQRILEDLIRRSSKD